jgi:hypothetical protein
MNDPLHELDAQYAALDEPTLMALFDEARRENDTDALEPLVRQLVLRAVPIVQRTVREFGAPRGLAAADLGLIEEEALTKLMLRLGRGVRLRSIRVLAYEIARLCAEDPDRRPAPAPTAPPPRPGLSVVDGGLAERARTNGHRGGRRDG